MATSDIGAILMLRNENKLVHGQGDAPPPFTMLRQQLEHLQFCRRVYVLDGMSTDGSRDVYREFSNVSVIDQPDRFDENVFLNMLLGKLKEENLCGWMLNLDGDELLEEEGVNWLRSFASEPHAEPHITVRFNYVNLWRSRRWYRTDARYGMEAGKVFRVSSNLWSFGTKINDHHFAYGRPANFGRIVQSEKKILHFAWVDWDHMLRKVERVVGVERDLGILTPEREADYRSCLDERGIVTAECPPHWLPEYRHG